MADDVFLVLICFLVVCREVFFSVLVLLSWKYLIITVMGGVCVSHCVFMLPYINIFADREA